MEINTTSNATVFVSQKDVTSMAIKSIIYVVIMVDSLLLISAILSVKKLRTQSNVLIVHLAVCDILRATFGIPFNVISMAVGYFPFGFVGCKVIYSFTTHNTNAIVLTFVCIAIERYMAVSSFRKTFSPKLIVVSIFVIHFVAMVSVLPLSLFLTYSKYPVSSCNEQWPNKTSRKIYTMFLFLVQYGIPLPIMVVLYTLTWLRIRKQNKRMIDMSEAYEKKMHWEEDDNDADFTCDINNVEFTKKMKVTFMKRKSMQLMQHESEFETIKSEMYHDRKRHSLYETILKNDTVVTLKRKMQYFTRRKSFMSVTAYLRHKQTVSTFKMFLVVVAVFAIFSLPNQILWIKIELFEKYPSMDVARLLNYLSFTNAVLNCWIYGGFSKTFRKAYRDIILTVLTCGMVRTTPFYESPNTQITSVQEACEERPTSMRQRKFSEMFRDHVNNFEKYRHLYKLNDVTEEQEETNVVKKVIDKRKKSIAHFFGSVLQTSSRKNSVVNPTLSPQLSRKSVENELTLSPGQKKKSSSGKTSILDTYSPISKRKSTSSNPSKRKMTMIPPVIPFTEAAGNAAKNANWAKEAIRKISHSSGAKKSTEDVCRRHSSDNSSQKEKRKSWRNSYSPRNSRIISDDQIKASAMVDDSNPSAFHTNNNIREQRSPRLRHKKLSEDSKFRETVRRNPSVATVKKKHVVGKTIAQFEQTISDNNMETSSIENDVLSEKNKSENKESSVVTANNDVCDVIEETITPAGHMKLRRCATLERPSINDLVSPDEKHSSTQSLVCNDNQANEKNNLISSKKDFNLAQHFEKESKKKVVLKPRLNNITVPQNNVLYIDNWNELHDFSDLFHSGNDRTSKLAYQIIKDGERHTVL